MRYITLTIIILDGSRKIAKNDPLSNGKKISKTGEYYNMNRAVSTKEDVHNKTPNKQEKAKKHPENLKRNQKHLKSCKIKKIEEKSTAENSTTISKLTIPIDLRDYVRNEKYLSENIKSLEDYSGTTIIISHNYDKIIVEGTVKNINKVVQLLDKNGSGSLDTPSWQL